LGVGALDRADAVFSLLTADMIKKRRARSDSAAAAVSAMAQAAVQIEPPAGVRLREGDRPYWDLVVRARAPAEWSEPDLMHAANMARCLADIERISNEVAIEGDVIENARGTPVQNPKHALLEVLSRRSVALTRLLQMHAQARLGRPEDVAKGRAAVMAAREVVDEMDDLLARPGLQ
jgi:hypothetical protein